jgi:DNA-binding response OmpR family regulator
MEHDDLLRLKTTEYRNLAVTVWNRQGLQLEGSALLRALSLLQIDYPEVFLLDIMLPEEVGSVLSDICAVSRRQIYTDEIHAAKGSEFDVVTGKDCVDDDYLQGPLA